MISRSDNITDFCVGTVRNQETKFLPTGPPPVQSSSKGKLIEERQWGSLNNRERAWGMNTVFRLEVQRDANSIWSNFSRVTLLSKLNYFSPFNIGRNCALIAFMMQLKGWVGTFPVYGGQGLEISCHDMETWPHFVFSGTNPIVRGL